MSNQPEWHYLANLGDTTPLDYGGFFVFEDTTGKYAPEVEVLEPQEHLVATEKDCKHDPTLAEGDIRSYIVYRFSLERCTYINGVLSNNPYHPDYPVWWAEHLNTLQGEEREQFLEWICSDDLLHRAWCYQDVTSYYGTFEFDHYPLYLSRAEVIKRYQDYPGVL